MLEQPLKILNRRLQPPKKYGQSSISSEYREYPPRWRFLKNYIARLNAIHFHDACNILWNELDLLAMWLISSPDLVLAVRGQKGGRGRGKEIWQNTNRNERWLAVPYNERGSSTRVYISFAHSQAAQAYIAKLAKRRHYKTSHWEFTRFSKILEYCYYCGNKVYLPSVHRVLVCCVHFGLNLRSFRARTPQSVPPYKLYRMLVSSHAICKQIAKSSQQNLLPARQSLPKRHKWNISIKPNK